MTSFAQTVLQPQIVTSLRCRWPRPYYPKPLWYERELEALERQEAALWEKCQRAEAQGFKIEATRERGKHGRVVGRILKLHEVLLRGEA